MQTPCHPGQSGRNVSFDRDWTTLAHKHWRLLALGDIFRVTPRRRLSKRAGVKGGSRAALPQVQVTAGRTAPRPQARVKDQWVGAGAAACSAFGLRFVHSGGALIALVGFGSVACRPFSKRIGLYSAGTVLCITGLFL